MTLIPTQGIAQIVFYVLAGMSLLAAYLLTLPAS